RTSHGCRSWWNLPSRWSHYHRRLRPDLRATSSVPSIASTLDAHLNLRVDQLAQRMDDQRNLMRQLLNQISLAQNLSLGQPGEERRMDKCADRQLDGVDSRRQVIENPSQAQSTNTPPRQRRREGQPWQINEEVNQHRPNLKGRQCDRPAMCAEDVEKLMNDRLRDLKTGGNFEDALHHLYNLRKKSDKSLRDYIKRLKAEKANIVGCDDRIASSAFKKGLPAEHNLYRKLTITHSQTVAEMDLETKINKPARLLIGFNDATTVTVGTIDLDVYSSPVISSQTFMVINEVSPYNDILGRP
ncbi:unnamed protein product, partial [Prunus brigantina]